MFDVFKSIIIVEHIHRTKNDNVPQISISPVRVSLVGALPIGIKNNDKAVFPQKVVVKVKALGSVGR